MISFGTSLYGAALSALVAAPLVVLVLRERGTWAVACAIAATAAAPIGWNAILRATHASTFFTDAPIAACPASWQDFGSGVFTLAAVSLGLGLGPLAKAPARRVAAIAVMCALAAFFVDVYLY